MIEEDAWDLQWPPELLQREGRLLLEDAALRLSDWANRVLHLLEEAFVGNEARDAFEQVNQGFYYSVLPDRPSSTNVAFLAEVVDRAKEFRQATAPRPYWPERRGVSGPALLPEDVRLRFVCIVEKIERVGYLDEAFPTPCVDDCEPALADFSWILEDRIGVPDLWPLRRSVERWNNDTFYGVIEVLHDLVARPRQRDRHDWNGCGWHWSKFARAPGQALYRWYVNDLLDRSACGFRLAEDGEDRGRLVAVTDDARSDLAARMASEDGTATRDAVRHALALFRAREGTEHDKRSAIVELAGVLEERRALLKATLSRKDEGALFQIANEFGLRHRTATQKDDYDPMFLDWVFWNYLSTIELSDRLLAR